MNNKEEFEKLAKQGYEEVDKNKNGSLDFNEIKSIMRFINNAAEEIVIRKNKIYSKKTNEVLAEYQSKK